MRVKICGITNLDDALAAVELGADMIGFNFFRASPRYIAPTAAARIINQLREKYPQVKLVGVFVNEPAPQIQRVLSGCNLDVAQLSGDEPVIDLEALDGRAFKALRPADRKSALDQAEEFAQPEGEPALLFDANVVGMYGGSGQTADWEIARQLAGKYALLLAGGLTPDNLSKALNTVNPWGVDVASGVETAPGRKDYRKMANFIETAHQFERGASK